jgi:leader peptidase (prepilin peptidase)/N-methyltransferase
MCVPVSQAPAWAETVTLQGADADLAVMLLVLAPIIGSFLGVLVRRLPEGRAVAWSRSYCEGCGARLRLRDLVPIVSWLAARGRCRYCGRQLGLFYPGIELMALLIALISLALDGFPWVWLDCVLGWWLLALSWIDLRHWLLPDSLTLPLVVLGLLGAALLDPGALFDRALGAALGYLAMRAIALVYRAIRQREGLGGGDAKLLAAAGAWVGASSLPQVILAASLAALAVAAVLHLRGTRLTAQSALPFGPFLGLAIWAVWLSLPRPL